VETKGRCRSGKPVSRWGNRLGNMSRRRRRFEKTEMNREARRQRIERATKKEALSSVLFPNYSIGFNETLYSGVTLCWMNVIAINSRQFL
jgi:hypothetical protein